MNHKEYLEFHRKCCEKMMDVTARKNADYCGDTSDAFANFKLTDSFGVASVEQGFFTRMTDKLSRIAAFIKVKFYKVTDESVEDTLIDLANYCILFAGYLRSKSHAKELEAQELAKRIMPGEVLMPNDRSEERKAGR